MKPHFRKVEHFLSLGLFDELRCNEWKFKVRLDNGTTYNPDFYHPVSDTYIEVATSPTNVSSHKDKWREALTKINLRIFWWQGYELSDDIRHERRIDTTIVNKHAKPPGRMEYEDFACNPL